ncbi:hypothetical protein MOUN0_C01134 [Monosporozyma unispora]|nr:hypothetical protein C6P44_005214 [Kazachstania unispora]
MKVDSNIYSEAQRAARTPQFRYLMLGLVCGAVVPTMYARHYFLPHYPSQVLEQERAMLPAKEQSVPQSKPVVQRFMGGAEEENTYMLISSIL